MRAPGWDSHPLAGEIEGHSPVGVSGNWRLVFMFEGSDAVLVDYQGLSLRDEMRMHNPPHPERVLREYQGTTSVTDAAEALEGGPHRISTDTASLRNNVDARQNSFLGASN